MGFKLVSLTPKPMLVTTTPGDASFAKDWVLQRIYGSALLAESFRCGPDGPRCFLRPDGQWNAVVLRTLPLQGLLGNKMGQIQGKAYGSCREAGGRSLPGKPYSVGTSISSHPGHFTGNHLPAAKLPLPPAIFFFLFHATEHCPDPLLSVPC